MRLTFSAVLLLGLASSHLAAQATFTGYVRDNTSLRGLDGVDLKVEGVDRRIRSNKEGKYEARDVPAGAAVVHVRAVGYSPVDTVMLFTGGERKEVVFLLGKPAVTLDSVVSTAKGATPLVNSSGFDGFDERRKLGFGRFLDAEQLETNKHRRLSDLLDTQLGVKVVTPPTCSAGRPVFCDWRVALGRANDQITCTLEVRLNGDVINRSIRIDPRFGALGVSATQNLEDQWSRAFDLNSISLPRLVGVEVYRAASETPNVYAGNGSTCGVLLLWTNR